ncbi:MAG: hypothetical protein GY835_18195 [bacterium]|nr:hypothetical protein [bacterium]
MMADAEAVPRALKQELGLPTLRPAVRPGRAAAERTAKNRLAQWVKELTGTRLLQGGREYAETIGRHVDVNRVGASRNPDLKTLLEKKLPEFFGGM